MTTAAYHLRQVCVDLRGRRVLDVPFLEVAAGGITAIVGPNGAGKTTLLRVLAFLLAPTTGEVELFGAPVARRRSNLQALRRQVTLVAQAPFLFHRSVGFNVGYGLRVRGTRARGRIEAALRTVGLADFVDRPAWKLSGGEGQRLAIARALAIDPSVYLFDEPTANLDREYVPIIEAAIADLGARGKTVVLTTHTVEQAYRLGDSLLSLVDGRPTPAPLVNLLRGTPVREDRAVYLDTGRLRIEAPDGSSPRSVAIDPDDIIVSLQPLDSSARNQFVGRVVKIEQHQGGVFLQVDCGHPFTARITHHSYEEMGINLGARVYLTFKSSAIHVVG